MDDDKRRYVLIFIIGDLMVLAGVCLLGSSGGTVGLSVASGLWLLANGILVVAWAGDNL